MRIHGRDPDGSGQAARAANHPRLAPRATCEARRGWRRHCFLMSARGPSPGGGVRTWPTASFSPSTIENGGPSAVRGREPWGGGCSLSPLPPPPRRRGRGINGGGGSTIPGLTPWATFFRPCGPISLRHPGAVSMTSRRVPEQLRATHFRKGKSRSPSADGLRYPLKKTAPPSESRRLSAHRGGRAARRYGIGP